jgi:hypothetical protein
MPPKYPDSKVRLSSGHDNAFAVLQTVTDAMRKVNLSKRECDAYFEAATTADFEGLLKTTKEWVEVELA